MYFLSVNNIKYNSDIELSVFYFLGNALYTLQSSTGPNCLNGNKAFDFFKIYNTECLNSLSAGIHLNAKILVMEFYFTIFLQWYDFRTYA